MINLYPFQTEALQATRTRNRVAYYLDMGMGKTFVGSEKLKNLGCKTNLIVCQKSKIGDWMKHYETYYPEYIQYDLTDKKDYEAFIRMFDYWHDMQRMCKIAFINYDLVWRRKELLRLCGFTLMLDESSLIQNDTAKRTKFILQMNPQNVILLSGTPTSGKYENLWSQLHLLGWEISKELYNRQYVNWITVDNDGFFIKVVDKDNPYKHVERLKDKLRANGAFFKKSEECFDLPEQVFITTNVSTIPEYRRFRKNKVVTIADTELVGDTILTERLYCRMLCGHYNKHKLQAFSDLLESTNERLIVFYNYNAELSALKTIAQSLNRPISEINGAVKDLSAYEESDDSVTLIQYQAGAMGLNLQKANRIIYFTLTDKCELWMQSQKRIHRINQTKTCFYHVLICKNSIEESIFAALQKGVDYTDYLFSVEKV